MSSHDFCYNTKEMLLDMIIKLNPELFWLIFSMAFLNIFFNISELDSRRAGQNNTRYVYNN